MVNSEDGSIEGWEISDYSLPVYLSHAKAVVVKGILYVFAGKTDAGETNEIYFSKLDIKTGAPGEWQMVSVSLPELFSNHDVKYYKNKIYIAGGNSKKIYSSSFLQ